MSEPFHASVAHDDHVEAHAAAAQLGVPLQQQCGGGGDAPLLAAADAGRGPADTRSLARVRTSATTSRSPARATTSSSPIRAQEIARDDGEALRFEEMRQALFSASDPV